MTTLFIQNIGGGSLLMLFLVGLYFALWIYCLVDIVRSEFKDSNMKLIWIVIILFAQLIGPLIYLVIGKGTKSRNFT
ncbi:PLD nuclease N-terminal domain-containing protein [Algoriphagus halophytocola]|uniref:PLD nuclease N-terminal domain-containing protein n=1 Tax=Algoriphagus halophytocola TaxID=2991499 RepID=A0ABY6MD64_9BACT|nr:MULTISPECIES: PLD nuclease N-terminal domain-containing protein [unclassified Algoriphagus]UZD21662.1 PLD nuclease N-terminal domain-containing protein [Algoriphagus sp. TR-M5]WBL42874.1 PLD nuclease N-terminal domain-containing protein [Algoriphagus sp. TR-M9]